LNINSSNSNQNDAQIESLRQTTSTMGEEIQKLRKFIEDMHISVTEKDAEIIKLKMHLGDEIRNKQPQRVRRSLNESRDNLQLNQTSMLAAE
jgi:predicted metalloenzyme YecM